MSRRILVVIFPEFQLLDAAGPVAAFEIAGRLARVPGQEQAYCIEIVAPAGKLVASSSFVSLSAAPLGDATQADTVLVAGGRGVGAAAQDQRLLAWVQEAALHARRMVSVCTGTYVLAAAGLLDGRQATTHWQRSADFVRRFPKVRLKSDRIFVRDGMFWSSAGITAGIDLALALIEEDLGGEIARLTARHLVVAHRRQGGQSQFSVLQELQGGSDRFSEVMRWARENIALDLSVEALARRAGMSERNFARKFLRETGCTPARAIERLRIEAARARIEQSQAPIETIAGTCGFGDSERMRRAFIRVLGAPPQSLRRSQAAHQLG